MSPGSVSGIRCIAMEAAADDTKTEGSAAFVTLGKNDLAAAGAITVQANITWLFSGATVILNFLKTSMPKWDLPLQLPKI